MSAVRQHRQMALAVALVQHRAKISIVHAATGVARPLLRSLYRELHGEVPRGGPLATSFANLLKTRTQHASASLFAALYRGLGAGETGRSLDWPALVRAYDLYLALSPPGRAPLDINRSWALAVDFKVGRARLAHCAPCRVPYLAVDRGVFGPTCPLCALYARPA
jgi:hypothetical protein